jgi:hypothetical protein
METVAIVINKSDLDRACVSYIKSTGTPEIWWTRTREPNREVIRRKVVQLIEMATSHRVCVSEGV